MSFKFTDNYLSQGRVDRKKGDDTTYYDALVKGHTSQYGTIWGDGDITTGYVVLALEYEIDDNEKEWLKILIIKADRNFDWSVDEDWIPTDLLEKRPMTMNAFQDGINPVHWLDKINNIWRKTDGSG